MKKRNGMLAKVHIAKSQLGMNDADYRAVLLAQFGVESAKELNMHQLSLLMNHFISCGWKPGPRRKAKPQRQPAGRANRGDYIEIPDSSPYARQKRWILSLARRHGWDLQGLNTRIQRQFGVDHILFLDDQAALQTLGRDMVKRSERKGIDPYGR